MEKYTFLRKASIIVKVLAWLTLVVGVIGSIIAATSAAFGFGGGFAFLTALLGIIYSIVAWVFLMAASEIFILLIDVEENTRKASEAKQ
jgi:hypothetical protein